METGHEFQLRTFIALWPPDEVRARMEQSVRRWQRRIGTRGVKWVSPQNFHLTLVFLGNVRASALESLKERFRGSFTGVHPIEVRVAGAGAFPDLSRPRVLWVALQGNLQALSALQARAEESARGFGEPRDSKPFAPHLTVARFEWLDREQLSEIRRLGSRPEECDFGPWTIGAVNLMRSELVQGGSRYTVLERVRLEGS